MKENGKLYRKKGSCIQPLGDPHRKNCSELVSPPGGKVGGEGERTEVIALFTYSTMRFKL